VDQGETWHSTAPLPAGSGGLWPLISHQGKLLVGGQGGGIYRMVHSAAPWISSNTGLDGTNCYAFAAMGDLLFAGMADGVFRSDDGGATWTPSGPRGLVDLFLACQGQLCCWPDAATMA
jgi:hypothetical protein